MNISVSHYISNTYNNPHFAFFTCGKISFFILVSAKSQKAIKNPSAMPINRRCGCFFEKVSPPN